MVGFTNKNTRAINYGGDQNNLMKKRDDDSWQKYRAKDRMREKQQLGDQNSLVQPNRERLYWKCKLKMTR